MLDACVERHLIDSAKTLALIDAQNMAQLFARHQQLKRAFEDLLDKCATTDEEKQHWRTVAGITQKQDA